MLYVNKERTFNLVIIGTEHFYFSLITAFKYFLSDFLSPAPDGPKFIIFFKVLEQGLF